MSFRNGVRPFPFEREILCRGNAYKHTQRATFWPSKMANFSTFHFPLARWFRKKGCFGVVFFLLWRIFRFPPFFPLHKFALFQNGGIHRWRKERERKSGREIPWLQCNELEQHLLQRTVFLPVAFMFYFYFLKSFLQCTPGVRALFAVAAGRGANGGQRKQCSPDGVAGRATCLKR